MFVRPLLVSPIYNLMDVCMTRYHRAGGQPVVWSGFNLWSFRRQDCKNLVDFVLQELWGLSRAPSPQKVAALPRGPWSPEVRSGR